MDFGRVPEYELNRIDFRLPPDGAGNKDVLGGRPVKDPKIYIGCPRWGRKEWVGRLYPKGTKESNFLNEYAKHYNTIELNATHYKLYSPADIERWVKKVEGRDFHFCPKVYQGITHLGSLEGKQILTDAFLEEIVAFGDYLGPVFLQVSDKFDPSRRQELFRYLSSLPTDVVFFLEVRHPAWFQPPYSQELFQFLRQQKIGAVITDTAGRRDCAHTHLTIPTAFIRYVGNNMHPTDYTRIDDWVKRIGQWLDEGLQQLYFFMHMHDDLLAPDMTVYLIEQLNKTHGLNIRMPQLVSKPPELF